MSFYHSSLACFFFHKVLFNIFWLQVRNQVKLDKTLFFLFFLWSILISKHADLLQDIPAHHPSIKFPAPSHFSQIPQLIYNIFPICPNFCLFFHKVAFLPFEQIQPSHSSLIFLNKFQTPQHLHLAFISIFPSFFHLQNSKNSFRPPPLGSPVEPLVDPLQSPVEFPVSDFSKFDQNESIQKGTRGFLGPFHTFLHLCNSQIHLPLPPTLCIVTTREITSIIISHKNTQKFKKMISSHLSLEVA